MNSQFTSQQKFSDNFNHVSEYFKLLTQYYSQWQYPNIKCTYYCLDIENSLIDKDKLNNGAYEMVGDWSGWRWRKILDFPINGVEALSTTPVTDEKGVTYTEKLTTCWFSGGIQIDPHVHDFIVFSDCQNSDNYYLRNPPMFECVNVERSPDFDTAFFKISLKVTYIPQSKIDNQIDGLFHYIDYEKAMYGIDNSISINTLLNERSNNVCNEFYNQNTGLYLDKINLLE